MVSPLLLNVALHGMEQAAGVRYRRPAASSRVGRTADGSPVVVRYADDLVAMCVSREQAEEVKARLAAWLAPRGLAFNEDKTRVVTLDEGFDFLGFNVRRYHGKLLIKPSKAATATAPGTARRRDVGPARVQRRSGDHTTEPDHSGLVGPTTGRWCPARHSPNWTTTCGRSPTSGRSTATRTSRSTGLSARYFGQFNKSRRDRWVFGDRDSGAYLLKFAWTKIVRHQMVTGHGVPGRPRPGRLLGQAATAENTAAGRRQSGSIEGAARTLPTLR